MNTPLNPDALASMARIHFESGRTDHRKWEHLYPEIQDTLIAEMRPYAEAVLAVAQPEVNSVEELDALPVGSVIMMRGLVAPFLLTDDGWESTRTPGKPVWDYTNNPDYLPARVLYRQEVKP